MEGILFLLLSFVLGLSLSQDEGCDLSCPEGSLCVFTNTGEPTCFPNEHPCNTVDCATETPICAIAFNWQPHCITQGLANCGLAFCETGSYCTVDSNDQPICLPLGESNPCQPDSCIYPTLCVLGSDGTPYCIIQAAFSPTAPSSCDAIQCEAGSTCVEDPSGAFCIFDAPCDIACIDGRRCDFSNNQHPICVPDDPPCQNTNCTEEMPACVTDLNFEAHCVPNAVASCGASFCSSGDYCQLSSNQTFSCLPLKEGNPCFGAECLQGTICILDHDLTPYCVPQALISPPLGCELACDQGFHCEFSNKGNPICVPEDPICTKICSIDAPFCTFDPSFEEHCISEGLMGCSAQGCSEGSFCTVNQNDEPLCQVLTQSDLCWDAECPGSEICIQDRSGLPYCIPIALPDPCAVNCSNLHHCELSEKGHPICVPDYYFCNLTCPDELLPVCVLNENFEPRCVSQELAGCGTANCPENTSCAVDGENQRFCLPLGESSPCYSAECPQLTICSSQGNEVYCVPRAIPEPPQMCTLFCDPGFRCEVIDFSEICVPYVIQPTAPQVGCSTLECDPTHTCIETPSGPECIPIQNPPCLPSSCPANFSCSPNPRKCLGTPCPLFFCLPAKLTLNFDTLESFAIFYGFQEIEHGPGCGPPGGPCARAECQEGEICVESEDLDCLEGGGCPNFRCVSKEECPGNCGQERQEVCSGDQRTFWNQCLLSQEICETRRAISVAHQGPCQVPRMGGGCSLVDCGPDRFCFEKPTLCLEPCDQFTCRPLSYCNFTCPEDLSSSSPPPPPVCGKDGNTYPNECELKREECRQKRVIDIASLGPCQECPRGCPSLPFPVCGTDNQTYPNRCFLSLAACHLNPTLSLAYDGQCGEPSNPQGECPEVCEAISSPVCGDDGVTYSSECMLRIASCRQNQRINVAHQGECSSPDPCDPSPCSPSDICLRPPLSCPGNSCPPFQCVPCDFCPSSCPEGALPPICGSDGVTYLDECRLRLAVCIERRSITIEHHGECGQPVSHCGQEECTSTQLCLEEIIEEPTESCQTPPCSLFSCYNRSNCPDACTSEPPPICGSDGLTYSNECALRAAICETQRLIRAVSEGECP